MKQLGALLVCACAAWLAFAAPANAQGWPDKPIRLIIPTSTGGGMDSIGRAMAEALTPLLKQPVVVENRMGGNQTIGSNFVVHAAPDGYTLLLVASQHTMIPWVLKNIPYDVFKDFTAVAPLGNSPLVFVSSTQSGIKTVAAFRDFVKRQEPVVFAGSSMETRLGAEMVAQSLGIKPQLIPYKGTGPAMTDIAGGHVPLFVTSIPSVLPFKDGGRVNLIGVAAKERNPLWPEVPTLAEQGLPVEAGVWYGIFAPAGTPASIVQRLNTEIANASRNPVYVARMKTLSVEPMHATPAEFDSFVRGEAMRWRDIVKTAGIAPE